MEQLKMLPGKYPHIKWIDLESNGIMIECAIMKEDKTGITYFPLSSLDEVDRRRLFKIIKSRNAPTFPLWDLMSQITLNNGVNALEYFHQLVKIITPSGQKIDPLRGKMGLPTGMFDTNKKQ